MSLYLRLTLFIVGFFIAIAQSLADNKIVFEKGAQAFAQKNYSQAINYFKQARTQGYNQNTINYNLGVSYFKLKQYAQAEAAFRNALRSPKLKQLVQYNLGLVKLKQQRKTEARQWFKLAQDRTVHPQYYNDKISRLAAIMSGQPINKNASAFRIDGGASVAYGYDSNVTLTTTGSPSALSDQFTESFAYLYLLMPYTHFKLNYYDQSFSTYSVNDYRQLEARLEFPFRADSWTITPGVYYTSSKLDRQNYQSINNAALAAKFRFAKRDSLLLRYNYSDIAIENPLYNYLAGSQQRFRAELINDTVLGQFRLRYEYEYNDRVNTPIEDFSPGRHSFRLRLKNSITKSIKIKNEFLYRNSVYNPVPDGTRKDNRRQYLLTLYVLPVSGLEIGVKYLYTTNKSNFAAEHYTRRVTQAYLYYYF